MSSTAPPQPFRPSSRERGNAVATPRSRESSFGGTRAEKIMGGIIVLLLGLLLVIVALSFLGARAESTFSNVGSMLGGDAAMRAPALSSAKLEPMTFSGGGGGGTGELAGDSGQGQAPQDKKPALPRKIIYSADLSLIVKDFTVAETALRAIIEKYDGRIATSDLGATTGVQRTGRWKIRIPVANFEAFLAAAGGIGEPERNKIDSQDVTEEFYDVQARINNKRVEETRLIQLLKDATGKLTEILAVEKELSRVRGEIEQMQGRLEVLSNLTSLTTVTVTIREIKDYVPPSAPTYGTKLSRAFFASWEGLIHFGESALLVGVTLVPWLPLILALFVAIIWLMRSSRKRAAAVAESAGSPG